MSSTFIRRAILIADILLLMLTVSLTRGHGMLTNLIAFGAGLLCALLVNREVDHV